MHGGPLGSRPRVGHRTIEASRCQSPVTATCSVMSSMPRHTPQNPAESPVRVTRTPDSLDHGVGRGPETRVPLNQLRRLNMESCRIRHQGLGGEPEELGRSALIIERGSIYVASTARERAPDRAATPIASDRGRTGGEVLLGCAHLPTVGNMPEPTEWLSVRQVADQLGVSLKVVYGLVKQRHLEAERNPRRFRIRSADLDTFISAHRIQPGTIGPSLRERRERPSVGGSPLLLSPARRGGRCRSCPSRELLP